MINSRIVIKFILLIPLSLLIIGLLSAWLSPCMGWEANIYTKTPLIFWIGIFSAYIVGIFIILYSQFWKPLPKSINYIAWAIMILAAISMLFLAEIRGYGLLNISGDTGSHLGNIKQTIENAIVPLNTYYPGNYWEVASFSLITGISVEKTMSLFPILMICLGTLGIYILARHILPTKKEVCLVALIAIFIPCGSSLIFFRTTDSLFLGMNIADVGLLSIFLYMIFTCLSGTKKMLIPLLIMNIAIVFYHPNVTVICLVIYVALILFSILPHFGRKYVSSSSLKQLLVLFFSLIGITILWVWKFYGNLIIAGFLKIFEATNAEDRGISRSLDIFSAAETYGFGIDTALRVCAINVIIYGFLILAGILLITKYWKNKRYFLLKALFICAIALGALVLIAMLGNFGAQPNRFLRVLYIAGIISSGFIIYKLFNLHSFTKLTKILHLSGVFALIAIICFISVLSFWPSPNTLSSNFQSEDTINTGAETLLPRIDYSNTETTGLHFTGLQRYVHAIYGSPYTVGSYAGGFYHIVSASRSGPTYADPVPYHFGYDTGNKSLSNIYTNGAYVFIIDKDKKYYNEYYPKMVQFRWTPQDFKQLSFDPGANLVYNNRDMEMYMILPEMKYMTII